MLVMLKSINAVTLTNARTQMGIALDNRIDNAWITCQAIDTSPLGTISLTIDGNVLCAHNTHFDINQERVFNVNQLS